MIQSAAIVASAVAAIAMIHVTRSQSRKRATVEMLLNLRLDTDYIDHRNKFKDLINSEPNLAKYADKEHSKSAEYMVICRILNYHEYIATGVHEGAFDESVYKRMSYSNCIKDWARLKGFVIELREMEKRNTLFQEFEMLATRWKSDPLKNKVN